MCKWKRISWLEPDVFLECDQVQEAYQTLDNVRNDFEIIYEMAFGKGHFDEKQFKNCLEDIAHLLQIKSCHQPIALEKKVC